jgi:Putative neutral zinc metallopeptidase
VSAAIWLLLLGPFLLGLAVQALVRSVFRRYSLVANHSGVTGAEAARALLDAHGLQRVGIEIIPGFLTDHYDGRAKALRLSEPVRRERSVSALGIRGRPSRQTWLLPRPAVCRRSRASRRNLGGALASHRNVVRRSRRPGAREQPLALLVGYSPSTANVLPSGSLNHATFPPPALGDIPRSSVVSPS